MKRRTQTILVSILSVGIVLIFILESLCRLGVKCKNCTITSNSKTESKEDGFFIGNYRPLNKTLKLSQHNETIEFGDVWVESQWFIDSKICLLSHKKKRDGYNVVFEFKKSNDNTFLFSLSPIINGQLDETNGGIEDTKKEIRLDNLTDTLWLQVHEKNPKEDIGWKKEIKGEKIGFVKN